MICGGTVGFFLNLFIGNFFYGEKRGLTQHGSWTQHGSTGQQFGGGGHAGSSHSQGFLNYF